jgi:hypothetical protein
MSLDGNAFVEKEKNLLLHVLQTLSQTVFQIYYENFSQMRENMSDEMSGKLENSIKGKAGAEMLSVVIFISINVEVKLWIFHFGLLKQKKNFLVLNIFKSQL